MKLKHRSRYLQARGKNIYTHILNSSHGNNDGFVTMGFVTGTVEPWDGIQWSQQKPQTSQEFRSEGGAWHLSFKGPKQTCGVKFLNLCNSKKTDLRKKKKGTRVPTVCTSSPFPGNLTSYSTGWSGRHRISSYGSVRPETCHCTLGTLRVLLTCKMRGYTNRLSKVNSAIF